MQKISVVGLGKLGMCFAACAAKRGYRVLGIDVDERVVGSVNRGVSPIVEPGLQEILSSTGKRLEASTDHSRAVRETDMTFILVATPSDPDGNFSNRYVESALVSLAEPLAASGKEYHLFVVSSTLMPSSTEERLVPLLERHSGRELNRGFGLCYVPDFIALGSALRDFLEPDVVVIGESSPEAGSRVESFYGSFCENRPYIGRMSILSAEIAKVSLNAYITMKISFANLLGNVCEKNPAADVDAVTKAIGADRRISPHYLRAGLAYGGTCFPRDTKAFIRFAGGLGVDASLIRAVEQVNASQNRNLCEVVRKCVLETASSKVAILGTAFKPETPVITESPAIYLIDELLRDRLDVMVYDRLALDETRKRFGNRIRYSASVSSCLAHSPVCVVTTPSVEFKKLGDGDLVHRPSVVVDCWRILDGKNFGKDVRYVPIGKAP